MFTASNGTQFDLSGLYGKDVDIMPAREFAAALFKSNAVIPWPCFHPASLMQITAHLRKTHNPADIEGRRKGKNTLDSAWTFVYKLANQKLPAVPSYELILMSSNSPRLTFELDGSTYRIPRIDSRMFRHRDLDVNQFIKILSSDNPGCPVGDNVVKEALRQFARVGFPAAPPGLEQRFLRLYQPLQHGIPKQELSQPKNQKPARAGFPVAPAGPKQRLLELEQPQQGIPRRESSRLKEQKLQKLKSSTPSTLSGPLSIQTLPSRGARESPERFHEGDREALASEGCALSVIPRMDPAVAPQLLKSRIYGYVLRVGATGLIHATWYSNVIELVLVYTGTKLRDEAFAALRTPTQQQEIERVDILGPVSPRQYRIWSVKLHHGERLEDVSTAMKSYFAGSGYASRCILSPPGNSDVKKKTLITFEHAPPYINSKLLWPDGLTMTRIVSKLTDINPFPSMSAGQPAASPYPALGVADVTDAKGSTGQSENGSESDDESEAGPGTGNSSEVLSRGGGGPKDDAKQGIRDLADANLQQNAIYPFGEGPIAALSMSSTAEHAPLVQSRETSGLLGFQASAPLISFKRKSAPSPPSSHSIKKPRLFPFGPSTSLTPSFPTRPIPIPAFGKPSFPVPAFTPWQMASTQSSPPAQSNGFTAPVSVEKEEKAETQVDDFLDLLEAYVDAQLGKGKA